MQYNVNYNKDCSKPCSSPYSSMPIAMAYVPWQDFNDLYDLPIGYNRGTIFKELDKPFKCRRCGK